MANEKKFLPWFRKGDRPDAKAEDTTPTLRFFFKLLKRKFGKLLSLNLMMAFMVVPLLIAALIPFMGDKVPTVAEGAYSFSAFLGISIEGSAPSVSSVLGIISEQLNVPTWTTGKTVGVLVLIGFTLLTWGWQNVGAAYNLRSLVRGDSCFLWSDYFYAIRRNLRQGFVFGLLDALCIVILVFDFIYFSLMEDVFVIGIFYIVFLVLLLLYIVMRFYIYQMMVTFDLSIFKLLKNALIFTMLGIKRNLMALLGIIVLIALNVAIIVPCLSVGFSVPIILPLFYFPALSAFIATYAAWPNIQRYMIDPYDADGNKKPVEDEPADTDEDEPSDGEENDSEVMPPLPPAAD
ncbi:MAG: hypothetical protein IKM08_04315 [Clostridia bacterium]|nr:hypothetical protein [Clostridia bacterium]